MRNIGTGAFTRLASLVVLTGLLAACCPDPGSGSEQRPVADASKTKGIDPKTLPYVRGVSTVPWESLGIYVDPTRFSGDFPDASIDAVLICDRCARVDLHILPEKGSYQLRPRDFTDSVRVIATVVIDSILENDSSKITQLRDRLGIYQPEDEAFLVTFNDSTAAFMYRAGDKVAFSSLWQFEADNHGNVLNGIQARWKRLGHISFFARAAGREERAKEDDDDDDGDRDHVSQAWLSCAEGCCTATAQ